MKCSICGTESKGDARLCAGCGATLITPKADETMLDLRTALFRRPVIVPAAAPAPVAGPPAASQQATPPSTARARSSIGGLLLVLVALGVIGYFVYQVATTHGASLSALWSGMSRTPAEPAQTAASSPATAPPAESVAPAGVPPTAEVPPPATPVPQPTRDPAPAAVVAVPTPAPAPEPAKNAAAPVSAPPITKSAASSPKPAIPRSSDARAPKSAESPASAPVVAAAAVPAPHAAAAAPRSDRWQDMKDARTRCGRENLISRVVCEQRVLYLYCDGYWGKVPQCPEAQNPDPRK